MNEYIGFTGAGNGTVTLKNLPEEWKIFGNGSTTLDRWVPRDPQAGRPARPTIARNEVAVIGLIYKNPDGSRFQVVGRFREEDRTLWWTVRNLDPVFDVPAGARWKRRCLPIVLPRSPDRKIQ